MHPITSTNSEPTPAAKITLERTRERTGADLVVPADPSSRLAGMVTGVTAIAGAVLGPALTLAALPPGFPVSTAGSIIGGQLGVLATVAALTARRHRSRTKQ